MKKLFLLPSLILLIPFSFKSVIIIAKIIARGETDLYERCMHLLKLEIEILVLKTETIISHLLSLIFWLFILRHYFL